MNPYKTDNNQAAVDRAPIFASVWLTLFNELRKNQVKRQSADFTLNATAQPKAPE